MDAGNERRSLSSGLIPVTNPRAANDRGAGPRTIAQAEPPIRREIRAFAAVDTPKGLQKEQRVSLHEHEGLCCKTGDPRKQQDRRDWLWLAWSNTTASLIEHVSSTQA